MPSKRQIQQEVRGRSYASQPISAPRHKKNHDTFVVQRQSQGAYNMNLKFSLVDSSARCGGDLCSKLVQNVGLQCGDNSLPNMMKSLTLVP